MTTAHAVKYKKLSILSWNTTF